MDNETKLRLLIAKREYIFHEIQVLYDLSSAVISDKSKIGSFKCRYKRIHEVRQEFADITYEINSLKLIVKPEDAIDMQTMNSFDTMYYAIIEIADNIFPPLAASEQSACAVTPQHLGIASGSHESIKAISQARLPKIELIKFGGNIEHWQTFYETFLTLVHTNNNISNIEKFHYLLTCLGGTALSIAKGIPVTADNYKIVFDALIDRYQNKRILAVNYLEKICNHLPLKSCNLNELRKLTSLLQESVNALKSIKIDNLGEFILFYISSRKLDADTRKRFELQNDNDIPTFNDLLMFLHGYIKVLEVSEPCVALLNEKTQISFRRSFNNNKSSSYPAHCLDNTEQYSNNLHGQIDSFSNPGPYSNTGIFFNPGPYSNAGNCVNSGPYSNSGNYSMPGPYSADRNLINNINQTNSGPNAEVYAHATSSKYINCACCGCSHHSIYKCSEFQAKAIRDREVVVKSKKLCLNCLRSNHTADKCFSKTSCMKCDGRHHTLLHVDQEISAACPTLSSVDPECLENGDPTLKISSSSYLEHGRSQVLLGTCTVRARGPSGVFNIRALIDSGAQDCFVTSACAQLLGLPLRRCKITVAGLGQNEIHDVKGVTTFAIHSQYSEQPTYKIPAIVMKTITHKMPLVEIPEMVKEKFKHLNLADNYFDKPAHIDLLIGAELFHNIYDGQRLIVGPGLPVALHSVFGWVITGKLDPECRPPVCTTALMASTLALDNVVKKFWESEEPPLEKVLNPENELCERLYTDLVRRNDDGRYIVPMLLREQHQELGDSFQSAVSRFYNLEKRLLRDEQLKHDYDSFMKEYEELGHMEPAKISDQKFRYVIPHHCVLKPDSATTKLRVVFDASAKTTNGQSLNDMVHTGPKLLNDIVDIITKFRLHPLVFTADISKMYRNIELRQEDRKYQHILWRNAPANELREYELKTVTYGVSSSPYLAIRTLHQLAKDHGYEWPQAASILREDIFMDDITAGAPNLAVALDLKFQLVQLLNCGKFELRKWSSNSPEFLAQLPSDHCQTPKTFCDHSNQQILKILGVQWDPTEDIFTYSLSGLNIKYTKRSILSNVARIYDPLGWLTPMVLKAKLLIQDLWRIQLSWDDEVPENIRQQWAEFVAELSQLKEIKIPRYVYTSNTNYCELIGFCDGSSKAYGCCVYLRSVYEGKATVNLIIAKSKVAPIKPLTVNRLELLGAVLLARVLKHMAKLLRPHVNLKRVTALTDSSTVLAWLNTEPYKLKTFVSHRVVKISDAIALKDWHHVSTHDNPADLSSRGLSCSKLIFATIWWSGPVWLASEVADWPISQDKLQSENMPELRNLSHLVHAAESVPGDADPITEILEKYSVLSKVQRILAWCLRFLDRSRRVTSHSVELSTEELERSLCLLIRHEQERYFSEEIHSIKRQDQCSRAIQKLNPFIDQRGFFRVGGRLENSSLPLTAIYPQILSKKSPLSILIIDYYHRLHMHCGPRTLQSLIQRKYWITGIRNLIRSRISKCVTCYRARPVIVPPLMGNLPLPRVQPARCFQNIGVDFAGPFLVRESKRRSAHTYKAYVCVMVCLAVKAIHIELVTDLSTPAFIAALDRFVSRRGLCKLVVSDCGTNFVGAKRYLNEVQQFLKTDKTELNLEFNKRSIIWQHNPPTGSHFGGIFESGVKSIKYHLKRVVGLQILTYEELLTILNKVEAILNSRPLCALSSDPTEVNVLTPGHFLTGGPLVSLPETPLTDTYLPPRERWQLLQKLTQSFWKVWQNEYLHTLQQRQKWFKGQANPKINDVVVIVEQNLPPLEWRLGRVTALHPGNDGVVRVVTLRTAYGLVRRPVIKICPLPINS